MNIYNMMKVSVILVTYNQEKYIIEALESILMQRVDFEYEIIIADDFSTDNTRNIAEEYIMKYPEKIRILPAEKNLGITKNYQKAFKACQGEYIAVLEGDDLWMSPLKLKKQVNLMDAHPECNICFNRFIIKDEGNEHLRLFPSFKSNGEYDFFVTKQLVLDNFIGNFSACMYRKFAVESVDDKLYELKAYDWMFNIVCSQNGSIGYLPEVMSLYRYHSGGVWSAKNDQDKANELLILIDQYDTFLKNKYHKEFSQYKLAIQAGMATNHPMQLPASKASRIFNLFIPLILVKSLKYLKKSLNLFKHG